MSTESLSTLERFKRNFTQGKNHVLVRNKKGVFDYTLEEFSGSEHATLFPLIPECAVFSALAYLGDDRSHEKTNNKVIRLPKGWRLLLKPDYREDYARATGKRPRKGLVTQVWCNDESRQVVIAFRGSTSDANDWLSNFRPFVRWTGKHDHYDVVHWSADRLVAEITSILGEGYQYTSTGHSLGGGLAQMAAYSSVAIKNATVFNSSPITGHYQTGHRESAKAGLSIARVYEHGEGLAYIRLPMRLLYWLSFENPYIAEIRFNFAGGNLLKEHGIARLATGLLKALREKSFYE